MDAYVILRARFKMFYKLQKMKSIFSSSRIFLTIFFLLLLSFVSSFFIVGDEILVVNGKSLQGMKHAEAIAVFKSIKTGDVLILIGRRMPKNRKTVEPIEPVAVTKEN